MSKMKILSQFRSDYKDKTKKIGLFFFQLGLNPLWNGYPSPTPYENFIESQYDSDDKTVVGNPGAIPIPTQRVQDSLFVIELSSDLFTPAVNLVAFKSLYLLYQVDDEESDGDPVYKLGAYFDISQFTPLNNARNLLYIDLPEEDVVARMVPNQSRIIFNHNHVGTDMGVGTPSESHRDSKDLLDYLISTQNSDNLIGISGHEFGVGELVLFGKNLFEVVSAIGAPGFDPNNPTASVTEVIGQSVRAYIPDAGFTAKFLGFDTTEVYNMGDFRVKLFGQSVPSWDITSEDPNDVHFLAITTLSSGSSRELKSFTLQELKDKLDALP